MTARRTAVTFAALVVLLGAVAALAPEPWFITDKDVYEATARDLVVRDCSDLQCFRVLVPWVLGRLPGPSLLKWKAYAVVATAAMGVALGRFCLVLGLSVRASQYATWLAAFGFGPLLTLFNPHTPDSLMYLLGPLIATELLLGRRGRAGAIATVGVLGKEVAAAPLWIVFLWSLLRRRFELAARVLSAALAATIVWLVLQLWLMLAFNYSYGGSASADLAHGGDFVGRLGAMGARGWATAIFVAFGATYLLIPIGVARAPRDLRLLAIAALPAAVALSYVQQPDRALWNFQYVIIPLAVVALEYLPDLWCWTFVACSGLANLRIGAQLAFIPNARYPLLVTVAIAAAAAIVALRQPYQRMAVAATPRQPWPAAARPASPAATGAPRSAVENERP